MYHKQFCCQSWFLLFSSCALLVMFRAKWCFLLRSLPSTETSEVVLCSLANTLCMSLKRISESFFFFPSDCTGTLMSHQQGNKAAVKCLTWLLQLSIAFLSSVVDSTDGSQTVHCTILSGQIQCYRDVATSPSYAIQISHCGGKGLWLRLMGNCVINLDHN